MAHSLKEAAGRHKVFISYHHNEQNQKEVDKFVSDFDKTHDVFIYRALGIDMADDIIHSTDPVYVMRCIREKYIKDSTVTIVLLGNCTWARRYVDWEIQASLYQREGKLPNGLLGIRLPSTNSSVKLPKRLEENVISKYAKSYAYPSSKDDLIRYINGAFAARNTLKDLIKNPRERRKNNSPC
jgi:hypothetical protein